VCHFPVSISFVCVQYLRLNNACAQLLRQRNYIQLQKKHIYYTSTEPPFILLLLLYALRVSSREPIHASFSKGAFLYSGHISALMFSASLLRNSQ